MRKIDLIVVTGFILAILIYVTTTIFEINKQVIEFKDFKIIDCYCTDNNEARCLVIPPTNFDF